MFAAPVLSDVQQLVSADPASCDRCALGALVTASVRVRAWLDAYDVRIAQCVADLAADGGSGAADVLAAGGRRSTRDAAAAARRARSATCCPT